MSGPASHTTSNAGASFITVQSPLYVFVNEGFRQLRRMRFEVSSQRFSQQFVYVLDPAFFHKGPRLRQQFRRQLSLNRGAHAVSIPYLKAFLVALRGSSRTVRKGHGLGALN